MPSTINRGIGFVALLLGVIASIGSASAALPDPDGRPADMTQPVQVYIMMGQSNILGAFGRVNGTGTQEGYLDHAVDNKGLYPYLKDDAGNWTQRNDVRYVRVQANGGPSANGVGTVFNNQWLNIDALAGGNPAADDRIGVEHAIGHQLGHAVDAPVMILTSAFGGKSLNYDLLPPGSPRFERAGRTYAGYGDSPSNWITGTTPVPAGDRAGLQYDGDVARAKAVLDNIGDFYPGATEYEVAGFFWWQGDADRYDFVPALRYEDNLVRLIGSLRNDFDAPDAKFVLATLGQTKIEDFGPFTLKSVLDAQLAVDGDAGIYPEFAGNVATVYSNPLLGPLGGSSNGHYNGDAETYMNVGEAMGAEMVALIPEPTSLALLMIGGVALLRRRR
jgi:hypothetical protein